MCVNIFNQLYGTKPKAAVTNNKIKFSLAMVEAGFSRGYDDVTLLVYLKYLKNCQVYYHKIL